jgi:glutathione S-transferase
MQLIIGNKLYSSWSLRPWMLMKALKLPFEDTVVPLYTNETATAIKSYAPSGKVPILVDGDTTVWESLAIIEYLHDRFPDAGVWPSDMKARAHARVISSEMHAGFQPLRQACPMNLGAKLAFKAYADDVSASVARVEDVWADARDRFGAGGAFLFGQFSAADAMYAPVVTRLNSYGWPVTPQSRVYMDAILGHPAFLAWRDQALVEPWYLPHYETGHTVVEVYRKSAA